MSTKKLSMIPNMGKAAKPIRVYFAYAETIPEIVPYLTPMKEYEILMFLVRSEEHFQFMIKDDKGRKTVCSYPECPYLNKQRWIIFSQTFWE